MPSRISHSVGTRAPRSFDDRRWWRRSRTHSLRAALAPVLLLLPALAGAGDIAEFVNLGFSADARYYMFGQFGVQERGIPYASVQVVDVPANRFAAEGGASFRGTQAVDPGAGGEGALYRLLGSHQPIIQRYGIDHLASGRLLYILLDGDDPLDEIDFRDFVGARRYRVRLVQAVHGSGSELASSFHLVLNIVRVADGVAEARERVVGNADFKRAGVLRYALRQVLLAPDGRSLVFVVERHEANGRGFDVRYMVETVRL